MKKERKVKRDKLANVQQTVNVYVGKGRRQAKQAVPKALPVLPEYIPPNYRQTTLWEQNQERLRSYNKEPSLRESLADLLTPMKKVGDMVYNQLSSLIENKLKRESEPIIKEPTVVKAERKPSVKEEYIPMPRRGLVESIMREPSEKPLSLPPSMEQGIQEKQEQRNIAESSGIVSLPRLEDEIDDRIQARTEELVYELNNEEEAIIKELFSSLPSLVIVKRQPKALLQRKARAAGLNIPNSWDKDRYANEFWNQLYAKAGALGIITSAAYPREL